MSDPGSIRCRERCGSIAEKRPQTPDSAVRRAIPDWPRLTAVRWLAVDEPTPADRRGRWRGITAGLPNLAEMNTSGRGIAATTVGPSTGAQVAAESSK